MRAAYTDPRGIIGFVLLSLAVCVATAQQPAQAPALQWEYISAYDASSGRQANDLARALDVDPEGTAYLVGAVERPMVNPAFATLAISPDGGLLWKVRYVGPRDDQGTAYAVSYASFPEGDGVVVAGATESGARADYATLAYWPDGSLRWLARYNSPDNFYDAAWALLPVYDGAYVTGYGSVDGLYRETVTIRYDGTGEQAWVDRFGKPGTSMAGVALELTEDGGAFVAASGSESAVIRYASGGQRLWATFVPGQASSTTHIPGYAVDLTQRANRGDVLAVSQDHRAATIVTTICAVQDSSCPNHDVLVSQLSDDGTLAWADTIDTSTDEGLVHDQSVAVATDRSGSVYTLYLGRALSLARYTPQGRLLGITTSSSSCRPLTLHVTLDGVSYVLAECNDGEATVLKIDEHGRIAWEIVYQSDHFAQIEPEAFAVSEQEEVWIAGTATDFEAASGIELNARAMVLAKFSPATASGLAFDDVVHGLLVASPNPARDYTRVQVGPAAVPGDRVLTLYDILGRQLWQLRLASSDETITVPTSALASGVYMLTLSQQADLRTLPLVVAR